ncbi:tyrosine-protein kinase Tec-like isoform X2 [Antedon mediterranea]|uniref:tyrosine-protein kinase Tec-like isoform X2 n=1 Tax=Antedon mediterranea TaxID=105859 RepID=UPI003AF62F52
MDGSDEILCGVMVKRSQNKRGLTPTNFKKRVFSLTHTRVSYYDTTSNGVRAQKKGSVDLKNVKVIQEVDREAFSKPHGIQICHEDYKLYFFASSDDERKEWVIKIQELCLENQCLLDRYHSGTWTNKWTCCEQTHQGAPGCKNSFKHYQFEPDVSQQRIPPKKPILQPTHQSPTQLSPIQLPNQRAIQHSTQTPPQVTHQAAHQPSGPAVAPRPVPNPPKQKTVIAKFDYEPLQDEDIALVKGEEYVILDDSREYWWKAKNQHAQCGFIPSNYVEEKSIYSTGLERYDWYNGTWNRQRTEIELKSESKEGCFTVRPSSTKELYTLSVLTKGIGNGEDAVRHYHVKRNKQNKYYISDKHCFLTMEELVEYHKHNAGGLVTRLRNPPGYIPPTTAGLGSDKWEINPAELTLLRELGSGQFGVVRLGKLKNGKFVAVKTMKEGSMSEDEFIEEAQVMKELQHENLVQLYGVSSRTRPLRIITEYIPKGCLLFYLRRHQELLDKSSLLVFMCHQVSAAMKYLESKKFIHRDLAARNCLVGDRNIVKVADFGLTRYVLDDDYTSSGTKFPIKWTPPEVLHYTRFSSKSDVWSFGILMWEVFSGGKMPYPTMTNVEVVDQVTRHHYRMEQPESCPPDVYRLMRRCWENKPEDRPPFSQIHRTLDQDKDSLQ